ncbi:AAA family ATPase [Bradyrhizobium nanningense]|nr:AAA family ATPase [Bradyrhizobium nanningense]
MSLLELDEAERLSTPVAIEALNDLCEWWAGSTEPEMSPPLCLGWDMHRLWPREGFALWRDMMLAYEPPLLARNLLGPGDPRQAVTMEQYEAALIDQWQLYDREKHWTDHLIIDVMADEKEERGYEPCGAAWERTEATLNDLAAKVGAKRAVDKAAEDAREARRLKRLDRFFDLDDAGYAKWLADGRPWSDAKKIERWSERRFYEELEKMKAMPVVPFKAPAAQQPDLLKSSGEFVAAYEPPDFLIDGILQRRYFYSLTAATGSGKTAIAMRIMGHVTAGRPLNGAAVEQGTTLYFAGENPTDVQARWLGLTRDMGISPDTTAVHFLVGAMDLNQTAERITAEVVQKGLSLALVIVDTAAAYNSSEDENSNTQAGAYARQLRSLTQLPGGPTVIVLCHPTKRAGDDDLIPRGGGAFLAEVDGNIAVQRRDSLLALSAQGKFRGPEFPAMHFELETVRDHPKLKDTKGRPIPTVIARPVGGDRANVVEKGADHDNERVLRAVSDRQGSSPTDLAKVLDWTYGANAAPNQTKVARVLKRLLKEKLVIERLGAWRTTQTGDRELNAIDAKRAAMPMPAIPLPRGSTSF